MSASGHAASPPSRLSRLLGFLARDPANLGLLEEAAFAAHEEGDLARATELIALYGASTPLPPRLRNLQGLVALASRDHAAAAEIFAALREGEGADPALGFNLAWARAMLRDYEGALSALNDETAEAFPAAAVLKVQMLHHLGRLDGALQAGAALAERHASSPALMGALAAAAMDAGDADLAGRYAARAGDDPEGTAARGLLALQENQAASALASFDRALRARPDSARAHLGKGLGLLTTGKSAEAGASLDRAAELFGDHLGSWIAAGWAYLTAGDLAAARRRFERALELDDTFAEGHGGLAVIDAAEGLRDSAERRIAVALRLDRNCFSAALAKSLLLAGAGDPAAAARVRELALNASIGPDGQTLGQALARIGINR